MHYTAGQIRVARPQPHMLPEDTVPQKGADTARNIHPETGGEGGREKTKSIEERQPGDSSHLLVYPSFR